MKVLTACIGALIFVGSTLILPANAASGPTVRIVWPPSHGTVWGTQVNVKVHVSGFRPGTQGHINYALDRLSNFVASRDASVSLNHGWNSIRPGQHQVIVYLANGSNRQIPGTRAAYATITVKPSPLGIASMPRTGGGADPRKDSVLAWSTRCAPAMVALR